MKKGNPRDTIDLRLMRKLKALPKYAVLQANGRTFMRGDHDPTNRGNNVWSVSTTRPEDLRDLKELHFQRTGKRVPEKLSTPKK